MKAAFFFSPQQLIASQNNKRNQSTTIDDKPFTEVVMLEDDQEVKAYSNWPDFELVIVVENVAWHNFKNIKIIDYELGTLAGRISIWKPPIKLIRC